MLESRAIRSPEGPEINGVDDLQIVCMLVVVILSSRTKLYLVRACYT